MTYRGKIEQNYGLTFMLSCYSINNIVALKCMYTCGPGCLVWSLIDFLCNIIDSGYLCFFGTMSMVTNDQPSLLLTNEKSTFVGLFDSLFTFLKYKKEEEEMHFFAGGTTDLVANIQLPESISNDRVVTEWSPMT